MRFASFKPPILPAAALFLLAAPAAFAEQYGPQVFNFNDDTTDLGDGTNVASSDGTASVQTGTLRLTQDGTADTRASFRVPALAASSAGWTATFEFALEDSPGLDAPGEGFSFNYGAIPAFNPGQGDPAAADAHGQAENGWHPSVNHLSFGVDTSQMAQRGFHLAVSGADLEFENLGILNDGQLITGEAALSWHPVNGASMSIDLGFGLTPVFTNVATPGFTGDDAWSFALSARNGSGTQTLGIDNLQVTTIPPDFIILPDPGIAEFMADNESTIEDEDCRSSDWLEILNSTANPVDFGGWFLTDNPANLTKWEIPSLVLVSNQRQLIFASGKDQIVGELHANFSFDKAGGFVALTKPDGSTIVSSYNYPQQTGDVSYGTLGQDQTEGPFVNPTPGTTNTGPQGLLFAEKPVFSLENQVITRPVRLTIRTTSPNATIRYTTDGNDPSGSSTIYTRSITISSTTRVKARVYERGFQPGPVRDRTFVRIATDLETFTSDLPIIVVDSFGFNIDNESNSNSQNPRRPVHAIFFERDPVTGRTSPLDLPDFEGRGGMRVRGQSSTSFPKKQYSFETWDNEGLDKNVSIFGMPSESDWVIHAPYSDKTLMRNKLVYDLSRELGYPAVRSKFCELFYNANGGDVSMADYRGVYVFMEKIKRDEDRVNIKKLEACDNAEPAVTGGYIFKKDKGAGSDLSFSTAQEGHTMAFVEPDIPTTAQRTWLDRHVDQFELTLHTPGRFTHPTAGYVKFIDVQSFIDTHLWVEVFKNIDGYRLSSYFTKDRGKKILAAPVWDYNLSLGNANYLEGQNSSGWYYALLGGGDYPYYRRLFLDPEFVIRYWDRYHALRENVLGTRYLLDKLDAYTAEIAEGAGRNFNKWGGLLGAYTWPNADGYQSRTTHQAEVDWMKSWLRLRLRWIDQQHSLPPDFNLSSGPVSPGALLSMLNPNSGAGTVYYTTNDTDPRIPGNATSTELLPEGASCQYVVPSAAIDDWNTLAGPADIASWSTGSAALGYETTPGDIAALVNTPVPEGTTSLYTRFTFDLATQEALDAFESLTLNMKFDDGYAAYLNGTKVAGPNAPVTPAWNSVATNQHRNAAAVIFEPVDISGFLGELRVGTNVLAVQFLNTGTTSTEFLGSPQLVAGIGGAAPSPSAQVYSGAIPLDATQTVKARVLSASGWSPLQTERFLVDGEPASSLNVAVTEVNYRPAPPNSAEVQLGYDARIDLEYLEIMNIGAVDVDLAGVRFTAGIEFDFDLGEVPSLAPGERAVIVSNRLAFESRYAPLLSAIRIAGEFTNNLSDDGETVVLSDATGAVIRNFTYNDKNPWPESADGDGMSLVLRNPMSNPDHNDPLNWRSSFTPNGVPGTTDGTRFDGDPVGDDDGNGIPNFFQYALASPGVQPTLPETAVGTFTVDAVTSRFMTFGFTRNRAADDVIFAVDLSEDLLNWTRNPDDLVLLSRVENVDGTETITYRVKNSATATPRLFGRLSMEGTAP